MSLGSGISCLLVGLEPLSVAIGPWLVTAAKQAFATTALVLHKVRLVATQGESLRTMPVRPAALR